VTRNPLGITRSRRTLHEYLLGDDSHGRSGQAAQSYVQDDHFLIPFQLAGTGGPPPAFQLRLHAEKYSSEYSNVHSQPLAPPHWHAPIYQRCQPNAKSRR
jgi:hypothetical protein